MMVQRFTRVLAIGWVSLSSILLHGRAAAQPVAGESVDPRAMELFQEGRALTTEGKYGAACAKFEESLRLRRGIGTLYNLADCYEKLGHTAKAWRGFRDAASEAATSGQPERAAAAQERADALEPSLLKLRILVSSEAQATAGLTLSRDGDRVPQDEWGIAVPVDPGNYRVSATAPGRREWSSAVIVREPGKVVVVSIPDLALHEVEVESAPPSKNTIIILSGAMVSVAALATGIGLTVAANSKAEDALAMKNALDSRGAPLCNAYLPSDTVTATECNALQDALSDRDSFSDAAVVAYVVGGLAAAGTAAYALWPTPKNRKSTVVRPVPVVTGREGGLWFTGTF